VRIVVGRVMDLGLAVANEAISAARKHAGACDYMPTSAHVGQGIDILFKQVGGYPRLIPSRPRRRTQRAWCLRHRAWYA
jgi:hypothetical protein